MGRVVPNCFNQDLKIYKKRFRNVASKWQFKEGFPPEMRFIWIIFIIQP